MTKKKPEARVAAAPASGRHTAEQVSVAAAKAHEANRAYCASIGDMSQVPWSEAPDWQRQSAINGVEFAIANDFPSPEAMHDNWMEQKIADGWMYGPVKNAEKKQHPCMVGYPSLPEAQKRKDAIFRETVMAALGAVPTIEEPPTPTPAQLRQADVFDMATHTLRKAAEMPEAFRITMTQFFSANRDAPPEAGLMQLKLSHGFEAPPGLDLRHGLLMLALLRHAILGWLDIFEADDKASLARSAAATLQEAKRPADPDDLSFEPDQGRGERSDLGRSLDRQG